MIAEVIRQEGLSVSHVIQNVPEHFAISIDEIMLFERVQDDGYCAVEEAC